MIVEKTIKEESSQNNHYNDNYNYNSDTITTFSTFSIFNVPRVQQKVSNVSGTQQYLVRYFLSSTLFKSMTQPVVTNSMSSFVTEPKTSLPSDIEFVASVSRIKIDETHFQNVVL